MTWQEGGGTAGDAVGVRDGFQEAHRQNRAWETLNPGRARGQRSQDLGGTHGRDGTGRSLVGS